MERLDRSAAFMNQVAHHFLVLSFRVHKPGNAPVTEFRSCFVVEVNGAWVLITAGHVVIKLCDYLNAGWTVDLYELHDNFAGHQFPLSGVPFAFDPLSCPAVQFADGDYAAWFLDGLTVAQLAQGGVSPIEQSAWGADPRAGYDVLLLLGLPSETCQSVTKSRHTIKPTLIPLELCDPPDNLTEPLDPNVATARLAQRPDGSGVRDVDGMSGGPIFGLREVDGQQRYFVAGVQSGWLNKARIVTFFAARPFFEFIADALNEAQSPDDGRNAS